MDSLRKKTYLLTYPGADNNQPLTWFNKIIILLTLFAIGLSVISTEELLYQKYKTLFETTEFIIGVIFTFEILLRTWSISENSHFKGWFGRIKFLVQPATLLDILATVPMLLATSGMNTAALRLLRLVRIVRFVRLGRFSTTLQYFITAFKSHWHELVFSFLVAFIFLMISATALFLIEGKIQPETFGSIPRAMWWAVATLTTVGYGDVYPITAAGKLAAGSIAIIGIGAVAMPAGIFAAAFNEAFQAKKNSQ